MKSGADFRIGHDDGQQWQEGCGGGIGVVTVAVLMVVSGVVAVMMVAATVVVVVMVSGGV